MMQGREDGIDAIVHNQAQDTRRTDSGCLIAIEACDLAVGYGGVAVAMVKTLRLFAGEAALLLGPSGSGKSTLLMTLAGLIAPISGTVALEGERFDSLSARERDRRRGRRIGLVFQDIHGVPGLSVIDNVLLGAFAVGAAQDRGAAMVLLDRVGLSALATRRFETLSRGEAQRVAIARALSLRPAVILADEPTASLDDANADRIADLFVSVAKETGAGLIVATHDHRLKRHIGRVVDLEVGA
jgi:ABC-type lipoprotein export system ATPase subunit